MKVGREKEDGFVHLNQLREKTKPLLTILMHPGLCLCIPSLCTLVYALKILYALREDKFVEQTVSIR